MGLACFGGNEAFIGPLRALGVVLTMPWPSCLYLESWAKTQVQPIHDSSLEAIKPEDIGVNNDTRRNAATNNRA